MADLGVPATAHTVEADVLDVPPHGVRTLPMLVRALKEGRANANPQIGSFVATLLAFAMNLPHDSTTTNPI